MVIKTNCKKDIYIKNLSFTYYCNEFYIKIGIDPKTSNWLLVWAYKKKPYTLQKYTSIYTSYCERYEKVLNNNCNPKKIIITITLYSY